LYSWCPHFSQCVDQSCCCSVKRGGPCFIAARVRKKEHGDKDDEVHKRNTIQKRDAGMQQKAPMNADKRPHMAVFGGFCGSHEDGMDFA